MAENRRFEGIWIPSNIWLSEDLTMQEKLFLVEIKSLDNDQGCFASNEHFAKLFQLSKSRCSEVISKLKSKNLVTIQQIYKDNSKQVERRIIRVNYAHEIFNEGIRKVEAPIRDSEGGIRKVEAPPSEKAKDNNTIINNTVNNTKDKDIDKDGQSSVNPLIDPNFESIKQAFEQSVRIVTSMDCHNINEALEFYEPALILAAIDTGKNNARSFKYILSTLDNWRKELGIKTYQDWVQKIKQRGDSSGGNRQQISKHHGKSANEMSILEKLRNYSS